MKNTIDKFYKFLDSLILPLPVKFLTNPLVILLTFFLLCPLIVFADSTTFVLVMNSYLNVTSVGVSSIVLRQTNLVAEQQEQRAQQDHETIHKEFSEIKEMHNDIRQLVQSIATNRELEDRLFRIEKLLSNLSECKCCRNIK